MSAATAGVSPGFRHVRLLAAERSARLVVGLCRSKKLRQFGPATKTSARHSVARVDHDHAARQAAKRALRYRRVLLTGVQARAVARGFAQAAAESAYRIHACAVVPNHVHLVVARHRRDPRRMIGHLKARATQQLNRERLWPSSDEPPVWAKGGGRCFCSGQQTLSARFVMLSKTRRGKTRDGSNGGSCCRSLRQGLVNGGCVSAR
jgi:REP element-mobilizing transposase RayT